MSQVEGKVGTSVIHLYSNVIHTETSELGHVIVGTDGSLIFITPDQKSASESLSSVHVDVKSALQTKPLFDDRARALNVEDRKEGVFVHYKRGVYRVIAHNVICNKTIGTLYEHLFPHPHAIYWRPSEMFDDQVEVHMAGGKREQVLRFRLVTCMEDDLPFSTNDVPLYAFASLQSQ